MGKVNPDRRDFIKGALALGAAGIMGTAMSGCGASGASTSTTSSEDSSSDVATTDKAYSFETVPDPIPESEITETIECEVLIVGAGISGTTAAAKASELSDDVRVIEKGYDIGLPRSATTGYGSRYQAAQGVLFDQATRDQMLLDFYMMSGRYQARIDLIALYIDNSGAMVDWVGDIIEAAGGSVIYSPPFTVTGNQYTGLTTTGDRSTLANYYDLYETSHHFDGPTEGGAEYDWIGTIGDYAKSKGAVFDFQTCGERIERENGSAGRASAVIAKDKDGNYIRYKASKGIILAAGDYINDDEMVAKYCPLARNTFYDFSNANCDGQMHKAAMWVGAGMDTMASLDAWPGQTITGKILRPDPKEHPEWAMFDGWSWNPSVAGFPMLYVDKQGNRFTNEETESSTGCMRMANCLASVPAGGFAWSIWDSAWATKFPNIPAMTAFSINTQDEIEIDIKEGLTFKADTLDELADKVGIPQDTFLATVDEYNAVCASGRDNSFLKQATWLKPIDTPPYYVSGIGMGIECVRGGLTMDASLQVTDTDGAPIEGLYAIGNNGGSFYGNVYPSMMGGTGTGHGMTFGMLAAEYICK